MPRTQVAGRGFCPSFARAAPKRPVRPPPRLSVAFLNVDDGGRNDPDRLEAFDTWLADESAAGCVVAAFVELNGWQGLGAAHGLSLLQERGAKAGFAFSTLQTFDAHPYALGLVSAAPVDVVATFGPRDGFERGVLVATTGGLTVAVAHLDAHSALKRRAEASKLAAFFRDRAEQLRRAGAPPAPTLLLGDLNTLAAAATDEPQVLRWLDALDATPGRGHRLDMRRKFAVDDRIDFVPADTLAAALGHDLCADACGPTIPTDLKPDAPEVPDDAKQLPLRVDYALANDAFNDYGLVAAVRRDDLTARMSDHFPLTVSWTPDHYGGGQPRHAPSNLSFFLPGRWT